MVVDDYTKPPRDRFSRCASATPAQACCLCRVQSVSNCFRWKRPCVLTGFLGGKPSRGRAACVVPASALQRVAELGFARGLGTITFEVKIATVESVLSFNLVSGGPADPSSRTLILPRHAGLRVLS